MVRSQPVVALAALGASLALVACLSPTAAGTRPKQQALPPNALQAEANSAAAGDIPDNQVFLVFRNGNAGWSMRYPEGWAQSGSAARVMFRDKNNIVRVVVTKGASPSPDRVRRDVAQLRGARVKGPPRPLTLPAGHAFKVVYATTSPPSPVTGKRVTLVVDRYYIGGLAGRQAVVDLGTPEGVDNVDAYRLMIESFRWR